MRISLSSTELDMVHTVSDHAEWSKELLKMGEVITREEAAQFKEAVHSTAKVGDKTMFPGVPQGHPLEAKLFSIIDFAG
jgi:hypothetical protein